MSSSVWQRRVAVVQAVPQVHLGPAAMHQHRPAMPHRKEKSTNTSVNSREMFGVAA
jgi:hypothetical protein